jgi:hypothetical protein
LTSFVRSSSAEKRIRFFFFQPLYNQTKTNPNKYFNFSVPDNSNNFLSAADICGNSNIHQEQRQQLSTRVYKKQTNNQLLLPDDSRSGNSNCLGDSPPLFSSSPMLQ